MTDLYEAAETLLAEHEREAWRAVPGAVAKLAVELAGPAALARDWSARALGPEDRLWLHPETREAWVQTPEPDGDAFAAKEAAIEAAPAGPWSRLVVAPCLPAPCDGRWVLLKEAASAAPLGWAGDSFRALQRPLGGPNTLTSTLVGGLLAGGVGYGAGRLAEKLLPEEYFERGALPRTLGLAGAGIGAGLPLWWGSGRVRSTGSWRSLLDATPDPTAAGDLTKASRVEAAREGRTGLFAPSIPVDAFNRAVWADAYAPPNPYGTKDPFGSNEQSLRTPPPVAATVSGIVEGAGAMTGREFVSPWEVGVAAASSARQGYLAGLGFGATLGALAGLKPEAQQGLQRLGLWGGALTGAVQKLFGR